MQPTQRLAQRRAARPGPGSFTFWFRRPDSTRPIGAWMLNHDQQEAAFLTTAGDAPRIGEKLELTGLGLGRAATPEPIPPELVPLPRFGRVIRLDESRGVTRRVAIRFEPQLAPVST